MTVTPVPAPVVPAAKSAARSSTKQAGAGVTKLSGRNGAVAEFDDRSTEVTR